MVTSENIHTIRRAFLKARLDIDGVTSVAKGLGVEDAGKTETEGYP